MKWVITMNAVFLEDKFAVRFSIKGRPWAFNLFFPFVSIVRGIPFGGFLYSRPRTGWIVFSDCPPAPSAPAAPVLPSSPRATWYTTMQCGEWPVLRVSDCMNTLVWPVGVRQKRCWLCGLEFVPEHLQSAAAHVTCSCSIYCHFRWIFLPYSGMTSKWDWMRVSLSLG